MTIDELMDQLADARHELGGGAQVRVAHQTAWPLRATVACVTVPGSPDPGELYGEDDEAPGQDGDGRMAWIALADGAPWDESPYAPRWAWREPSW